jgi:hypothetical protein
MGTRSTYRIVSIRKDEKQEIIERDDIALIYMQYDGYPSGHPSDVAEFLSQGRLVNGFGSNETDLVFNGAGCLAARLVDKLKNDKHGNCYLYPLKDRGTLSEDYLYDIVVDETNKSIEMIMHNSDIKIVFQGTPEEFLMANADSRRYVL